MGFRIQRHIHNIERATLNMPEKRRRLRSGGKRWDLHLRPTRRRDRLRNDEWVSTLAMILAMLASIAWLVWLGLG
jgi:hypothetical protein